jgi:hypothetical protein
MSPAGVRQKLITYNYTQDIPENYDPKMQNLHATMDSTHNNTTQLLQTNKHKWWQNKDDHSQLTGPNHATDRA